MTREEEIITACKGFLAAYPNIDQAGLSIGFLDGAVWSDKNPVNVWHDASEEPRIGSNIVVVDKKGQWWDIQPYDGEYDGYGGLTGWECCVVHYNNIQSWAYISDLLPKTK